MSTKLADFEHKLSDLIRSRFPIVHVDTYEEDRALKSILGIAAKLEFQPYVWTVTRGVEFIGDDSAVLRQPSTLSDLRAALEHCEKIAQQGRRAIFIFLDPYPFLSDKTADPVHRRRLREFAMNIRNGGYKSSCVIISPQFNIARELEKEVRLIDFPLPEREFVSKFVENFIGRVSKNPQVRIDTNTEVVQSLVDASLGLTKSEIENCLAEALVDNLAVDANNVKFIFEEKKQIIRKAGILEYIDTRDLTIDDIGGLDALKRWLKVRRLAFLPEAADYGIRSPKGVLLTGIPGCGKSLSAKCVAASWGFPLIKLDMGKIFSMWVGSSEEHIRDALKTCDAIAPCVLWIDEIEKGLAHNGRSIGDSGTSMRVFGTLLTWMQEKTSQVFLFATANDIEALPAELLRKGRFDNIFFVDLPSDAERKAILEIQLRRHKRAPDSLDIDLMVELSGDRHLGPETALTGAEIEAWVDEAMIASFARRHESHHAADDLSIADFKAALNGIVPISRLRSEQFSRMREWAINHAANASDLPPRRTNNGRTIDLAQTEHS